MPSPSPASPVDDNISNAQNNLAFAKPATQDSTWSPYAAARAVNGRLDDYQHTQNTQNAWWQVDLGQQHAISAIDIYNRENCCQERLNNFYVLVSAEPFVSEELQASLAQEGVLAIHVDAVGEHITLDLDKHARYLRVQLLGKGYLHMAEFAVRGEKLAPEPQISGLPESGELIAGDSLSISVSTADDSAVQSIDLFLNDVLVRTETQLPFTWNAEMQDDALLQNLAAGSYRLKALLTDVQGRKAEQVVEFQVAQKLDEDCEPHEAIRYIEQTCANSACHGGGAYPLLTKAGIAVLGELESKIKPGEKMLVAGDPATSWLHKKMDGSQGDGGGALMPLGAASPSDGMSVVTQWILDGAKTCDAEPDDTPVSHPNALDQTRLFSCASASAQRSSPARMRRILGDEYSSASQYRRDDIEVLERSAGAYFSTEGAGLSLDPGTVELLFLTKFNFLRPWTENNVNGWRSMYKLEGVHKHEDFECMFKSGTVSDACRDAYVALILEKRALFRTPTTEETSLIREVLDNALAQNTSRKKALELTVFTASLLPGALFRSELGDEQGRLRADELALALAAVLSPFPVGAPFFSDELFASDPDADDRSRGRFGAIKKAAEDGSIFDPEVRKALLRKYAFGVSTERPDLVRPHNEFDAHANWRGAYWLAPNIQKFFREWLDYDEITFKQSAASTSAFEDVFSVNNFYSFFIAESGAVNSRKRGRQPMLADALDDVIARVVIETDADDTDVFRELMSTNRFMLPANIGAELQNIAEDRIEKRFGMVYNSDEAISKDRSERWKQLPERTGVLTHPAWLAAHGDANEDGPSLVLRGKWIREHLFSQSVPSLEFVMVDAQLAPSHPDVSARERVRQATETGPSAAACRGCHEKMNSLGLPFEDFNHAGFVRAYDRGDGGVDSSTVINNLPDEQLNRSYTSGKEFLTALSESNYARRGFIRQSFRYFMGRAERIEDSCTLVEMESALDQNGSFIDMLQALVASETFTHRSHGAAQ